MSGGKKGKADAKSKTKDDGPKAAKGGKGGKGPKGAKGANGTGAESDATKVIKQKGAQGICVKHILCTKQSKALEALEKIRSGSNEATFESVAREYSEDKARNGGDLGLQMRGSLDAEFEKVAYDLKCSTNKTDLDIGMAKTQHGYHLIMVYKRV